MRKFDVVCESASQWRALSDDPQFVISLRLIRPRHLVFYLEAVEQALDPVLYFDRGQGFSEHDSAVLPHNGSTVFVISVTNLPNVVRIRLDPSSRPLRFKFWVRSIFRQGGLDRLASKLADDAVGADGRLPTWYNIGKDYAASPSGGSRPAAANIRQHFEFVSRLAAVEPRGDRGTSRHFQRKASPLISIVVPVYNTPTRYLTDLVDSFRRQMADDAELIFVDDGSTRAATRRAVAKLADLDRVTCIWSEKNAGIAVATNRGLEVARGRWVGFIDHDDALAPFALDRIKQAIEQYPRAKFFYTDEVITDSSLRPTGYILKPHFDPVLLSGVNYINHFSLYRTDLLAKIGGLRPDFDGSQDYDLLLRYLASLSDEEIVHVPYPAYLWRRTPTTYSALHQEQSIQNARRALADHFRTIGDIPIDLALDSSLHRPRLDAAIRTWPPVTVIIPSRNAYGLLSRVLDDLALKTDYPDLEIIVVDNGSDDPRVLDLYAALGQADGRFHAIVEPHPFNFSRQVNIGIEQAGSRHVLLLNNDVEITSSDWLREMVSCLCYPDVGIVGARLLYPDRTLQHAGVIVGLGGLAGHWFDKSPGTHPGPFGRLRVRQSLSAVTGACMLISRDCLDEVGMFDEHRFAVAYNDVDFCLRASARGFRIVWTPFSTLIHHESASRGSDESELNRERFSREKEALRNLHRTEEFSDPYFSPWYTRNRAQPGLVLLGKLPAARHGTARRGKR